MIFVVKVQLKKIIWRIFTKLFHNKKSFFTNNSYSKTGNQYLTNVLYS